MRTLHEPLTLPKHPQLLDDILAMKIAIKLNLSPLDGLKAKEQAEIMEAIQNHKMPTWDEVLEILEKSYHAINEQREDPRRY